MKNNAQEERDFENWVENNRKENGVIIWLSRIRAIVGIIAVLVCFFLPFGEINGVKMSSNFEMFKGEGVGLTERLSVLNIGLFSSL